MEISFAVCIAAGVVFGFLIASFHLRADRNNVYLRGKSQGENERAALEERLKGADGRMAELAGERDTERAAADKLRDEIAGHKAGQSDVESRIAEARRSAEEKAAAAAEADRKVHDASAAALHEKIKNLTAQLAAVSLERETARAEIDSLRSENTLLKAFQAEVDSRIEETRKAAEERLAAAEKARQATIAALQKASGELLDANTKKFLQAAETAMQQWKESGGGVPASAGEPAAPVQAQIDIEEVLKPVRELLGRVEKNLGQLDRQRGETLDNLAGQVAGLVSALRTPAIRSRWGGVQLRRVIEMAGIAAHCEFSRVENGDSENRWLVPDAVIHLPNQRDIVVDAKIPVSAYLESLEAADEPSRVEKLQRHAAEVRAHVERLTSRNYANRFERTPELIIAFLPLETAFAAALEHDPSLFEFGAERRVLLATPATLIALFKAVSFGWQQQETSNRARAILADGKSLYERIASYASHVEDLRQHLDGTVRSFNRGVGALEGQVLLSARQLRDAALPETEPIPVLDPVETMPRDLRAIESAAAADAAPAASRARD